MLTTEHLLTATGADRTGPVAKELAWLVRVRWQWRDLVDLWRALAGHSFPRRAAYWVRLLWYAGAARRAGRDGSDDWGL